LDCLTPLGRSLRLHVSRIACAGTGMESLAKRSEATNNI